MDESKKMFWRKFTKKKSEDIRIRRISMKNIIFWKSWKTPKKIYEKSQNDLLKATMTFFGGLMNDFLRKCQNDLQCPVILKEIHQFSSSLKKVFLKHLNKMLSDFFLFFSSYSYIYDIFRNCFLREGPTQIL